VTQVIQELQVILVQRELMGSLGIKVKQVIRELLEVIRVILVQLVRLVLVTQVLLVRLVLVTQVLLVIQE
jgi:hypothetical protein